MARTSPANKVRFAWWGAEEGWSARSTTSRSSASAAASIDLYLNFDLVASPNYMFGIYDGDDSGGTAPRPARPARPRSSTLRGVLAARGQPSKATDFAGRSDYGPFIAVGIPAGGLFTGAEATKTAAEAARYGGVGRRAYDPCYHQPCDDLTRRRAATRPSTPAPQQYTLVGNINTFALDTNADAIATAVITYAFDTSTVNGVPGHPGRGQVKGDQAQRVLMEAQGKAAR